jgi:hypothetical protein
MHEAAPGAIASLQDTCDCEGRVRQTRRPRAGRRSDSLKSPTTSATAWPSQRHDRTSKSNLLKLLAWWQVLVPNIIDVLLVAFDPNNESTTTTITQKLADV